ncbi:Rid family hydrolase [Silvibacterium sp.]|uniref:Rid family hydrolase n=1 Tax=Silvibacterium sp. TaxID=1964179 RepID=UPI0039E69687
MALMSAAGLCVTASPAMAQTKVVHIQSDASPLATAVWAGDTLYVSGQLASPVTLADAATGKAAEYGDTQTQATSIFKKLDAILKEQGLTLGDVVNMHVYMAGDPNKGGKLDFPGLQAAYLQYFGTKEQPNKPSRAAMQVAALAAPWALIEIEVIAVRSK